MAFHLFNYLHWCSSVEWHCYCTVVYIVEEAFLRSKMNCCYYFNVRVKEDHPRDIQSVVVSSALIEDSIIASFMKALLLDKIPAITSYQTATATYYRCEVLQRLIACYMVEKLSIVNYLNNLRTAVTTAFHLPISDY